MKTDSNSNVGMMRLIRHLRSKFETEENINHYSVKDFIIAERKYIKFMLKGRATSLTLYPGAGFTSKSL